MPIKRSDLLLPVDAKLEPVDRLPRAGSSFGN